MVQEPEPAQRVCSVAPRFLAIHSGTECAQRIGEACLDSIRPAAEAFGSVPVPVSVSFRMLIWSRPFASLDTFGPQQDRRRISRVLPSAHVGSGPLPLVRLKPLVDWVFVVWSRHHRPSRLLQINDDLPLLHQYKHLLKLQKLRLELHL